MQRCYFPARLGAGAGAGTAAWPGPACGAGHKADSGPETVADGIWHLTRPLVRVQEKDLAAWAEREGYTRYLACSIKGQPRSIWDDPAAWEAILEEILAAADRFW